VRFASQPRCGLHRDASNDMKNPPRPRHGSLLGRPSIIVARRLPGGKVALRYLTAGTNWFLLAPRKVYLHSSNRPQSDIGTGPECQSPLFVKGFLNPSIINGIFRKAAISTAQNDRRIPY
jgi:hypothetical protein